MWSIVTTSRKKLHSLSSFLYTLSFSVLFYSLHPSFPFFWRWHKCQYYFRYNKNWILFEKSNEGYFEIRILWKIMSYAKNYGLTKIDRWTYYLIISELRILSKQTVEQFGLLMIFCSMTSSEFVMIPNFETPMWMRIEWRNNYWLENRILPMLLPGYYGSMMMEFSLFSVVDDCCLWRNEREEK